MFRQLADGSLVGIALVLCIACSSPSAEVGGNMRSLGPVAAIGTSTDGGQGLAASGTKYVGVNLDWANDTVEAYALRVGRSPDVLVNFFAFPLGSDDELRVQALLAESERQHAVALITLEPINGLGVVSDPALGRLIELIRPSASSGVPVLVRFAHEMNGSWYVWGQQPEAYREAFVRVARAVRQVPGAAMLWAPNYGGGYPFSGGRYQARAGTSEFGILDTNDDGRLDGNDDPYEPYYPGDEWVDWVGMSLYHWGSAYPWGENEAPEPHKFVAQLTGTYIGAGGDETATPNFHAQYAVARRKPLAIPETAAFFQPGLGGVDEASIKKSWMAQVYSPDTATRLPQLRMINWFEWRKPEAEIGGAIIDWRATGDSTLSSDFAIASAAWRSR